MQETTSPAVELVSVMRFAHSIKQKGATTYIIYVSVHDDVFIVLLNSVFAVYKQYEHVFSEEEANKLPSHENHDHKIVLEKDIPTFEPLYNLLAVELEVLRDYIKKNLFKRFIRQFTSLVDASVLFIKKKNGDLHLCVDYRDLNKYM